MSDLILKLAIALHLDRFVAWLEPRLQHAVEWLGFTPTQRERYLNRRILDLAERYSEQRLALGRVERLIAFRRSLGATTIDVESLRRALDGTEDPA